MISRLAQFLRRLGRWERSGPWKFLHFPYVVQSLGAFLIVCFFLLLLWSGRLERFENIALAHFFKQRPVLETDPAIAFVEIAGDSIEGIGRWPWPRHYHAALTHILKEWGARAVMFDISFSRPSTPFDDTALSEAFQENRDVYLPVILEDQGGEEAWIRPLPELKRHARAVGHINIYPDEDGTLRRVRPYLRHGGEEYPHLALKVAYDYLGREMPPAGRLHLPLDPEGNLLINWAGPWKTTYSHYSYRDLLTSFDAVRKGLPPVIPPDEIRGKICLVGVTATGHADIKANPLEGVYPALGLHANVMNSVLTNRWIIPPTFWTNGLVLAGLGLLAIPLFVPFRPMVTPLSALGLCVAWTVASFLLFWLKGIWLYVAHPVLLTGSLLLYSTLYAYTIGEKERIRLLDFATHDGLTGLYVTRYFHTLSSRAMAQAKATGKPLSLILLDVDFFKKVNDTHGHLAGDVVLKGTARILSSCVRTLRVPEESDVVARYGGEEFIILLRNAPLLAACRVAERIRAAMEAASFQWENVVIRATVSLGVATFHEGDQALEPVIHRADQALYRAKVEGRNKVCSELDLVGAKPSGTISAGL